MNQKNKPKGISEDKKTVNVAPKGYKPIIIKQARRGVISKDKNAIILYPEWYTRVITAQAKPVVTSKDKKTANVNPKWYKCVITAQAKKSVIWRIRDDIHWKQKRESIRVPTSDTSKPETPDKKGGTK